ncbi:MAG: bifunctional folylpolyglutamate synthase/dihydrofolate synthase, partial [Chloroflexota bacterium]
MIGYEDTIAALDGLYHLPFQPSGIVGLRRAFAMLAELGNPHLAFRSVHVAGSSGKGSTSAMIASILRHAGYRTGFFQSPHLLDYTERISLGGMEISRDEWTCCFDLVWPVVQAMMEGRVGEPELGRPTLFEVLFAMAAIHFRDKGAEWAVLEAGLGGRLDATNTVQADVAVVTNVSLEHTRVLGSTVREIAVEKAAIIKSGVHAVTAATGEALEVIEGRAASVQAPLLVVPRDVSAHIVDESLLETRLEL